MMCPSLKGSPTVTSLSGHLRPEKRAMCCRPVLANNDSSEYVPHAQSSRILPSRIAVNEDGHRRLTVCMQKNLQPFRPSDMAALARSCASGFFFSRVTVRYGMKPAGVADLNRGKSVGTRFATTR